MIEIEVNNGRTMELYQDKVTQEIKCYIGERSNIDTAFAIPESDFVMLMNYYRYQKENNLPIL